MNTPELLQKYDEKQRLFEDLKRAGEAYLGRNLKKQNFKYELSSRIKEFDSFSEKALRKKMSNPFDEMVDIVGLRVICLFQSDVDRAKEVIRETFQVVKEDNKITKIPTDVFNYAETHFDVRLRNLPDDKLALDEKRKFEILSRMVFEIQVRTICQHAWSSISHNMFHKNKGPVPKNIERDFYAINGMFYIADTHFEMIKGISSTE
ncbi:MAG: RelA/SpoT domain-containing protein [Phycisphaerales bacterium]|jgi:ppGpp synthetase/RelA/SpoT-type nucleotidyltranferase